MVVSAVEKRSRCIISDIRTSLVTVISHVCVHSGYITSRCSYHLVICCVDKIDDVVVRPAKMASDSICATAEKALHDVKYDGKCKKEERSNRQKGKKYR